MEYQTWKPKSPLVNGFQAEQIIHSSGIAIIHVWAVWNNHDKRMDEILQILSSEFEGKVNFYSLDADLKDSWDFCVRHNVTNLPAIICYVNGRNAETIIGLCPVEQLRNAIQQMLGET